MRLKKMNPMILLHEMTMLTKLFCVIIVWFCMFGYFFWMKMVLLRLKKTIPMILLHVMTMLTKLFWEIIVWFCVLGYFFLGENGVTEVKENDSNDTIACDDDAHKVVLRNQSLILRAWLLFVMFFLFTLSHFVSNV